MTHIYQSTTFAHEAPDKHKGYDYARVSNPTRTALEGNLAALEGARHGICFASGVAGTDAIIKSLRPGDHVVAVNDLYGGTYRLFKQVYEPFGIEFSFCDMTDSDATEAAIGDSTKVSWVSAAASP